MYIALAQGQTTPSGQKLMPTERPYHFHHLFQVKKKSLSSLILYTFLMFFHMYKAPVQGQTTPWSQKFDANRKALSLLPFVASFKKISTLILYIFFNVFPHVYSPGAGVDNPLGTKV